MSVFSEVYLKEVSEIIKQISIDKIEVMAKELAAVRSKGGRLFFLGVGGSAGHAGHAVNDFRKLCNFESYAPTDNVSELTARVNDEGWETCFTAWLKGSKLKKEDALFIISVGGGDKEKNVSVIIVEAINYALTIGSEVFGIVGRDGGYTAKSSDTVIVIPTVNEKRITPHTEGMQAIVWHLLVTHPLLKMADTKWESL